MTEQTPIDNLGIAESKSPRRRRANGLLILSLFALIIFTIAYKPSVKAVYCNTETLSFQPDVIMLGASWCPYCYKARKYFVANEINYCEYNIEDDAQGTQRYAQINSASNNPAMQPLGIPILFIGDYLFSGFEEARIEQALAATEAL
ncbi:MAG: glutaredoxin family protein [Gammaproteobacteria bacterium]|nr:glutaredoxin family protein [Gammaproteobacteria bacterium]